VFDARGSSLPDLVGNVEPALVAFGRQLMLSLSNRDKQSSRWVLVADAPNARFRAP
jgi:hypothetical protein